MYFVIKKWLSGVVSWGDGTCFSNELYSFDKSILPIKFEMTAK
jgi:hypothetical protein